MIQIKMMKMKKLFLPLLLIAATAFTVSFTSCKGKPKDADIQAEIVKALAADPMAANTKVTVDKGVATLSGECKDDMCKAHCAEMVGKIKGVTSVVNNCTVAPVVAPVINPADDILNKGLVDALKDHPTVKSSIADGKIVLTGEIAKAKWMMLKPLLDKLKAKGYDLAGLKIN
jgi:hyperosmotically inducible periplasmic protein